MARRPANKRPRKTRSPGDYETELVRLCKGDRKKADEMILEELERSPSMSRQGAALAIVTRLRHELQPLRRQL
jgi:hypothetical protein